MRIARAALVLPVALLTGCGVAGTQWNPGVAADVDGTVITTRTVDRITDDYCKAIEAVSRDNAQAGSGSQATPLRYLNHEFASALVTKAAAEKLAAEYDVEPTPEYAENLASLEPQIADLPEDQQDAVREVIGANAYTDDVLTQIGAEVLDEEGQSDAGAEDQLAAGREALQSWAEDHDVEVNPRYGVEFGTGQQVDTDLSYADSTVAKEGLAPEVSEQYASSLPGNLVCLD